MQKKEVKRLALSQDCMVGALKLHNQAPEVSDEAL